MMFSGPLGPNDGFRASGLCVLTISPAPRIDLALPSKRTKSVVETSDIAEFVRGEFLNDSL